jgi:hypothetical protein
VPLHGCHSIVRQRSARGPFSSLPPFKADRQTPCALGIPAIR